MKLRGNKKHINRMSYATENFESIVTRDEMRIKYVYRKMYRKDDIERWYGRG